MADVIADEQLVADQIKKFFCESKREQLGKPYRPAERYNSNARAYERTPLGRRTRYTRTCYT